MAANIDCRTTSDLDDLTKHGESSRPVNRFSKMTATKLFPEYGGSRADFIEHLFGEYTGSLPVTFYSSRTSPTSALPKKGLKNVGRRCLANSNSQTNRGRSIPIKPSPVVTPFSAISESTDTLYPRILTPILFLPYDRSMSTSFRVGGSKTRSLAKKRRWVDTHRTITSGHSILGCLGINRYTLSEDPYTHSLPGV